MSKAILILDEMPECCYDCGFCKFNGGYRNGYFGRDCLLTGEEVQRDFDVTKSRHQSCPLKPMPERKEFDNQIPYEKGGWNDCIDYLTGDNDETH